MDSKIVFNYNKLCDKCKTNFQKIMSLIKEKKPELIKTMQLYQIIVNDQVSTYQNIIPFALIKHNRELYGFFLQNNIRYLSSEAKELLKQGQIILPSYILETQLQYNTVNVYRDAPSRDIVSQPKELVVDNSGVPNEQALTQTIENLKDNQHQIVQGLRKTFAMLDHRNKKLIKIFVILGVALLLFLVAASIGGWQLYLYLHQRTQVVLYDLSAITRIKSPEMINAKNIYKVEENEIKDSLKYLILQEVIIHSRGATFDDYDYHLFSDNKGAVFQPVNLVTSAAKIWVMIKARPNSKFLVNNTNYLAVTLPMLGEKKSNIAEIKTLVGPELLSVPNPERVSRDDIRNVYNSVIEQVVKTISNKAQLNVDYHYDIYGDENKGSYQQINLTKGSVNIWIVITAQATSKLIMGYTNLIKVTLQNHKEFKMFNDLKKLLFAGDGFLYVLGEVDGGSVIYRVDLKNGNSFLWVNVIGGKTRQKELFLVNDILYYLYIFDDDSIIYPIYLHNARKGTHFIFSGEIRNIVSAAAWNGFFMLLLTKIVIGEFIGWIWWRIIE